MRRAARQRRMAERGTTFYFLVAAKVKASGADTPLLSLQELRQRHPDWLCEHRCDLGGAIRGELREEFGAVSHRWEEGGRKKRPGGHDEPDPTCEQKRALISMLEERPAIKYVWVDFSCMPQGERTEAEVAEFSVMLRNVNILFLGCTPLIICDVQYMGRFWTSFEMWCSMLVASASGVASDATERSMLMRFIHAAREATLKPLLLQQFAVSHTEIYTMLSKEDILITNQNDKKVQLPKVQQLNDDCMREWLESEVWLSALSAATDRLAAAANAPSLLEIDAGEMQAAIDGAKRAGVPVDAPEMVKMIDRHAKCLEANRLKGECCVARGTWPLHRSHMRMHTLLWSLPLMTRSMAS